MLDERKRQQQQQQQQQQQPDVTSRRLVLTAESFTDLSTCASCGSSDRSLPESVSPEVVI